MAKIVVITGSPRKNGNTEKLAGAFIKGAEAAGHRVTKFSITGTKVNGCLACDYCQRNEGKCIQKDGMQEISEALYQADTIVLASPVYYFGLSAQIKAVVDRFYASLARPYPLSSSVLLLALGGDPETDAAAAFVNYNSLAAFMKWQDKGQIAADGVMDKDDIDGHPALIRAEELGKSL